jgi:hypothetical protein
MVANPVDPPVMASSHIAEKFGACLCSSIGMPWASAITRRDMQKAYQRVMKRLYLLRFGTVSLRRIVSK